MEDIKKAVLQIINREINKARIGLVKVILFGSRAEGNYSEDSDWDFLVIVDKDLSFKEKKKLWNKISHKIHQYFPFTSFDIIIKEKKVYESEKNIPNTISNEVYFNGVGV